MGCAAALAAPAGAAVSGAHIIAALPDSSGLELTGYPANSTVSVALIRNGVTITTGSVAIGAAGDGSINGGTTDCWTNLTPDIVPGDTVQVTNGLFNDTMVVQGTSAGTPVETTPGTVVVHGTASDPQGQQLPVTGVEARITSKTLFANGKRVLRAGSGQPFTLSYDTLTGTAWTATFSGLSPSDVALATSPLESRGVFTNAALNESTISQNPALRGPTAPCGAPLARYAVTQSSPSAVDIAHAGSSLVLSGVSLDASSVTVSLDDQDPTTPAVTAGPVAPSPASGAQTWSVTIPAAGVSGLREGTLTASATYATAGGPIGGATLSILKDLAAPGPPSASPSAGTYATAQSVSLADPDATAAIHWTNDGSTPTVSSPTFRPGGAILVTASQTIRAVAIDPAGNASPVATFGYTITQPVGGPSVVRQVPVLVPGGTVSVLGKRVAAPAALRGLSVTVLRGGRGLRVAVRVGRGVEVVRFRVFRTRGGRRTGAPVATFTRLPSSGRYVVTLRGKALRRLRPGRYVLEAVTGRGASATVVRAAFRV